MLRYEEDYSHVCESQAAPVPTPADIWDPVKCIRLGARAHLTLGGEARLQYERYDRPGWGRAPEDPNGYELERYLLHGDLHVGTHARAFVQLKSGLEQGRLGGPRPFDEDVLDLHQAFVDLMAGQKGRFTLRVGRQEIALGNSRLITVRDGANVRLGFDSVRADMRRDGLGATVFVAKPVSTRREAFDDATEQDRRPLGGYLSLTGRSPILRNLDLYYLLHTRRSAHFGQGIGRERRHTLGFRASGRIVDTIYDIDAIAQRGAFGGGSIEAWALAADVRRAVSIGRLHSGIGLRAAVGSGDRDPARAKLQTFHPLYPRGPEVSQAPLLGAANLVAVRPFVEVRPRPAVTVVVEASAFWRESLSDGLYDQMGEPLLPRGTSRARLVGYELSLLAEWNVGRHTALVVSGSRFLAGPYLDDVTPGRDLGYSTGYLRYRF